MGDEHFLAESDKQKEASDSLNLLTNDVIIPWLGR